jgi:hypothetical protein
MRIRGLEAGGSVLEAAGGVCWSRCREVEEVAEEVCGSSEAQGAGREVQRHLLAGSREALGAAHWKAEQVPGGQVGARSAEHVLGGRARTGNATTFWLEPKSCGGRSLRRELVEGAGERGLRECCRLPDGSAGCAAAGLMVVLGPSWREGCCLLAV